MKMRIGFIGQGWIGKNYADDFEARGFDVIRYALEEPYIRNKEKLADREIIFIAVPTPTTPKGFDASHVRNAIEFVPQGATAVIKSTILPGTTEALQKDNPHLFVVHSPEFLAEATAAYDASHPNRNIVGIPEDGSEFRKRAEEVMGVLPKARFELVCAARDAELIKYAGNCFLYMKVIYANMLYDLAADMGCDYSSIRSAVAADPRIGASHLNPIHQSGRGAGGHCFIKDFKAFADAYKTARPADETGFKLLSVLQAKNRELLESSGKDLDILEQVYGKEVALFISRNE